MDMKKIGPTSSVPAGTVTGFEDSAVGNRDGAFFGTSRRCRHLGADLGDGTISAEGCLVCPWHHAEYDVTTGRMVRGPQGVFAKIPGLGATFKALTKVAPLAVRKLVVKDDDLYLDD